MLVKGIEKTGRNEFCDINVFFQKLKKEGASSVNMSWQSVKISFKEI